MNTYDQVLLKIGQSTGISGPDGGPRAPVLRLAMSALALCLLLPVSAGARQTNDLVDRAERLFRGIYACNAAAVDELAAPDIVLTWPIFEEVFGVTGFVGRDAARRFAEGFCSRWLEPEVTFETALSSSSEVVLVWSFSARRADGDPGEARQSWGGMSLYRFDEEGLVEFEIGEESGPGPFARLRSLR